MHADTALCAHLSGGFTISVRQRHYTLVNLDAWDDALAFEDVHKRFAIRPALVECLLKENLAQQSHLLSDVSMRHC